MIEDILVLPFVLLGCFSAIALVPESSHKAAMSELQRGGLPKTKELSGQVISDLLKQLPAQQDAGTLLGVSKYTGLAVTIPDQYINQVALVLGTTGGGKTITLRRFYERAIVKNYPLIIIDGKPTRSNINWVQDLAKKNNREFYGFNCANNKNYDPLSDGGYTELKDKIISLKDKWENEYYKSIAEDYLQTTFEVLLLTKEPISLEKVVTCLNYDELLALTRKTKDSRMYKRVEALSHYDRKDITGLQAHLNILIHSELGQFFGFSDSAIRISDIIKQGHIAYFALPALRFPSFSKVLGKLVINDIKAIIDRLDEEGTRIFAIFDEFSVFAGDQVLNLVNMGRGKGVHAIFGTQGLADLETVSPTFKSQLLNCANTLICHRLNDKSSAEDIANYVGTRDVFTVTAQLNLKESEPGLGNVKVTKEFLVHPDEIKRELKTGEAFYVTKCDGFKFDKLKIILY